MITLLSIKTFFKKVLALCKKYWQILAGAAIPIVIFILTRKSENISKVLERAREDHKKELDIINESHKIEIQKRKDAQAEYFLTIQEIEKKYEDRSEELDSRKKQQIERLIEKGNDDPGELARKISEITGFSLDE
tara:strand:+ start:397 stop:801 length:405 start_codon:yes stop_codon:yes gene_type:complete